MSAEPSTIEECEGLLAQNPAALVPMRRKAELLVEQGDTEAAKMLFEQVRRQHPDSPSGLKGLLVVAVAQENDTDIRSVTDQAAGLFAEHSWWVRDFIKVRERTGEFSSSERCAEALKVLPGNVDLLLLRAEALRSEGDETGAEAEFKKADEVAPDRPGGMKGLVEVRAAANDWTGVLALASEAANRFPAHTWWKSAIADAFRSLGRLDELESFYQRQVEESPESALGLVGLARMADLRFSITESVDIWRAAAEKFPDQRYISEAYFRALLRGGLYTDADTLLAEMMQSGLVDPSIGAVLGAQRLSAAYEFDLSASLLVEVLEGRPPFAVARLALQTLVSDLSHIWENDSLTRRALNALSQREDRFGAAEAQLCIALGDLEGAHQHIADLEDDGPVTNMLRAWVAMETGDPDEARLLGDRWATERPMPPLEAPIVDFRLTKPGPAAGDHAIVVIVPVRNERPKLPSFFAHYRRLGIRHFVAIDNGSDDGSVEYLNSQQDVTLYETTDDFIPAGSGTRWVNHLFENFVGPSWFVVVDADELMVYPGSESVSLEELCVFLESEGAEVVGGFMLDMHPESPEAAEGFAPGDELLEHNPWFTNQYRLSPSATSPYTDVCGGFRAAVLGMRRQLRKAPLIKAAPHLRLLWNHETTPAVVSSVSSALLHFKFAGDPGKRATEEVAWSRWRYFANRQQQLVRAHEGLDCYLTDSAVRYESPEQLIALGLVNDSAEWKRVRGERLQSRRK